MKKDKVLALYEAAQGDSRVFTSEAVSKSYDAGANAILNEMAMGRLFTIEENDDFELSDETKKQARACTTLYNQLMEKIKENPELVAMLWQLDTEYSRLEMLSNEDHFTRAFIEGYNFRKTATGQN